MACHAHPQCRRGIVQCTEVRSVLLVTSKRTSPDCLYDQNCRGGEVREGGARTSCVQGAQVQASFGLVEQVLANLLIRSLDTSLTDRIPYMKRAVRSAFQQSDLDKILHSSKASIE